LFVTYGLKQTENCTVQYRTFSTIHVLRKVVAIEYSTAPMLVSQSRSIHLFVTIVTEIRDFDVNSQLEQCLHQFVAELCINGISQCSEKM
jgi:hypothetical protein